MFPWKMCILKKDLPGLRAAKDMNGSIIFFSTNHQDFELYIDQLKISAAKEITSITIPEDYITTRKKIHRCWKIRV